MKRYRFDYIREWVDKWNPQVPRTVEQMEMLPWDVLLPWVSLDENLKMTISPAKDHYWDDIEDLDEWLRQRSEYIKNLANEYETLRNEGK